MTEQQLQQCEQIAAAASPRESTTIRALVAEIRSYKTRPNGKLSDADYADIRARDLAGEPTTRIAKIHGVDQSTIYNYLHPRKGRAKSA